MKNILQKLNTHNEVSNFRKNTVTSFINPYSYLMSRGRNSTYEEVDTLYIDGFLLCWLLKAFGFSKIKRYSFDMTSLAGPFFKKILDSQESLFIIGSSGENVNKFADWLRNEYPDINLVGYRDGYIGKEPEGWVETMQTIKELAPDYVICGMGAPLQEKFLVELKKYGVDAAGITCGGFIHQTASSQGHYYPKWIDKLNLRFLYRMWDEPKLVKRYTVHYPKAVTLFSLSVLKFYLQSKKTENLGLSK